MGGSHSQLKGVNDTVLNFEYINLQIMPQIMIKWHIIKCPLTKFFNSLWYLAILDIEM